MTDACARAARLLIPSLDDLATTLAGRITASDAAYTNDGGISVQGLVGACRQNLARALQALGEPRGEQSVLDAAISTGRVRARQGIPLESVLRSYRLGGRVIWDALEDVFPPSEHKEHLQVAGAVWTVLDEQSVAMTLAYRNEQQLLVARDQGATESALSALLDGGCHDPRRAAPLARTLAIPPGARLVVMVFDGGEPQRTAIEACRLLHMPGTWLVRRGAHVGLVQAGTRTAASVRDALTHQTTGRVALSEVFTDLADMTYAVRSAELAHAAIAAEPHAVVLLKDRLIEALVLAAPDVAPELVRSLAQPLLDLGQEGADLLRTVEAVLACDGSHTEAARVLFVHRNTISYRLGRIERVAGVGLRSNADRVAWTLTLLVLGRTDSVRGATAR